MHGLIIVVLLFLVHHQIPKSPATIQGASKENTTAPITHDQSEGKFCILFFSL